MANFFQKNTGPAVWFAALFVVGLGLLSLASCAPGGRQTPTDLTAEEDTASLQVPPVVYTDLAPVDPEPVDAELKPGLAPIYYYSYMHRHLDPLTTGNQSFSTGRPGKPIAYLNHQFGRGEIFDSGASRGVAVRMKGLIRLAESGRYLFRALSNDGLRVYLGGTRIIDDPDQHSDRYAVQAIVEVKQAGWYALVVEYFQRKGTAALRLAWQPPSFPDITPVPAAAFAHRPQDLVEGPMP